MRRNSDISAHSRLGDGRVLPHGVVSWIVCENPSSDGMNAIDSTHLLYF
jgi:hypothetical protein